MSRRPFRDRPLPILETNAGGSLKTAALAFEKRNARNKCSGVFICVNFQKHRGFDAIDSYICDKGNEYEDAVDHCDGNDDSFIKHGEQNHQNKTDKKNCGADFSGKQRTVEYFSLAQGHNSGNQLEKFLYDK